MNSTAAKTIIADVAALAEHASEEGWTIDYLASQLRFVSEGKLGLELSDATLTVAVHALRP